MAASPFWLQQILQQTPGIAGNLQQPAPDPFQAQQQQPGFRGFLQRLAPGLAGVQGNDALAGLSRGFGGVYVAQQQAMQNAYENSLRRQQVENENRRLEMQQKQFEQEQKAADRVEKTAARGVTTETAGKLSRGLAGAKDLPAYWQLVGGLPEVQQTLQQLGIEAPSQLDPQSWQNFQQQLAAAGPAAPVQQPTDDQREYVMAKQQGYPGTFFDYIRDIKRAGAATTSVNLGAQGMSQPPPGYFRPNPKAPGLQMEPGGPAETAANKPTGENLTAAGYWSRMNATEPLLGNYAPNFTDYLAAQRVLDAGPSGATLANTVISPEGQQFYQAASDWVRAKLRKESGAVISPQEMLNEIRTYFPVPGDTAKTIEQKRRSRQTAMDSMAKSAGPALKAAQPTIVPGPTAGTVEGGYRFKGGDPSKKENWEKL